MYFLMGAGLCSLNDQNHKISLHLMQIYAVPHGLEALVLTTSEVKQLETYYRDMQISASATIHSNLCHIFIGWYYSFFEGQLDTRQSTFLVLLHGEEAQSSTM